MPYKDLAVRAQKQKEYSKRWYDANKEKHLETTKRNRAKDRKAFREFKSRLSCISCGESHPATLDFHHHTPHPSNRKVNVLITNGQYARAMEEIMNNCVVMCSNCHRKHHYEEQKSKKA